MLNFLGYPLKKTAINLQTEPRLLLVMDSLVKPHRSKHDIRFVAEWAARQENNFQ